jgi:predicted nucleic acid-binding Zn ribbon protein
MNHCVVCGKKIKKGGVAGSGHCLKCLKGG